MTGRSSPIPTRAARHAPAGGNARTFGRSRTGATLKAFIETMRGGGDGHGKGKLDLR
jgi:hypothetical protein